MNSANVDSILALRGPIIIFGAGGFIGARLAETLLKHRNDILAVTHQNDIPWRLSKVGIKNLVKCDQTNRAEVYHIFAHKKPRTVFAFAAYGLHRFSCLNCLLTNSCNRAQIIPAAFNLRCPIRLK